MAVARIGAVSDDEVVGHAVFHAALFVISVENARIAPARTTVVNDDILPPPKAAAGGIDLFADGGNKRNFGRGGQGQGRGSRFGQRCGGEWRAQAQGLADLQRAAVESIPATQIFQRDAVLSGNFAQGIPLLDFDGKGSGWSGWNWGGGRCANGG